MVSPYAAPARATDLTGLPDTYIDVGDLDIFRDEDITYARRLSDAGVPTELHLHPGCPHAFEALARARGRVAASNRRSRPSPARLVVASGRGGRGGYGGPGGNGGQGEIDVTQGKCEWSPA